MLVVCSHARMDGIIWKFCFGGWKLSWDLRSRLTYSLLMTGGTKSITLGFLLFLFLLVLDPVTCAGQKNLTEKPLFEDLAVHRASARFKLLCCSCSCRENPSRLRAAKSLSNTATFIGFRRAHLKFLFNRAVRFLSKV